MSGLGFQSVMSLALSEGEMGVVLDICLCLVFPLSCLPTCRKEKKLVLTHSCTRHPSVMSFYLSHCEKSVVCITCMYLILYIPCLSTYCKVKNGVVLTHVCTRCPHVPGVPMSCPSTYRKVKNGLVCNICLYLAFPLSCLPTIARCERVVVTYVCTWVMSFYLSQGQKRFGL